MKINFMKWLLVSTGFIGMGTSGASLALSTNLEVKQNEAFSINKNQLMNGIKINLSSLTNINDVISASLKQDMMLALSKNYKGVNPNDVEMHFYYGGSDENPEIQFKDDDFESILYFTVKMHSTKKQFLDSTLTFDYRPVLKPWIKNYNGYVDANIYRTKNFENYKNIGDLLNDLNSYLHSDYIKNDFKNQWLAMGVIANGLSNGDKQTDLCFSKKLIDYVNDMEVETDFNDFDTKIFDRIPDFLKVSIFKNFDSTLKIGYAKYYTFSSSSFNIIDKKIVLSDINKDYKKLKMKDFKDNILSAIRDDIEISTNNNVTVNPEDFDIVFKKSYSDTKASFDWDSDISSIDSSMIWVELNSDKAVNPFITLDDNPGFHIYINN